jgi:4-diphosphocytidyl-2-C-methyl-D-erythritol kinase
MNVRAPAKVNLWLHVYPPDETGFHPLDTLFCALDLADEINIDSSGDGIQLIVTGAQLGDTEHNLAWRAAFEFFQATGLSADVTINLQKNIPVGAGLGGGSSDAAAVLSALNQIHDGVLSEADVFAIAARLGSDVPFFLCGSSLAHATGRGEKLRALPPLPSKPALVIMPNFAISTATAYRALDEAETFADQHEITEPNTWDDIKAANTFETVLFERHVELRTARDKLRQSGARIALLSGSGSATFAIYDSAGQRDDAAKLNWPNGSRVLPCSTSSA